MIVEAMEPRRMLAASLFVDLNPGPAGSAPASFTPLADQLYFTRHEQVSGAAYAQRTLWVTDGTPVNTRLLYQPQTPSPGYVSPEGMSRLKAIGDKLWAVESDQISANSFRLYLMSFSADGTHTRSLLGTLWGNTPTQWGPINEFGGKPYIWYGQWRGAPYPQDPNAPHWFTADDLGNAVSVENPVAGGYGEKQYSGEPTSATLRENTYYAFDDGVHGEEIWVDRPARSELNGSRMRIGGTHFGDTSQLRRVAIGRSTVDLNDTRTAWSLEAISEIRKDLNADDPADAGNPPANWGDALEHGDIDGNLTVRTFLRNHLLRAIPLG